MLRRGSARSEMKIQGLDEECGGGELDVVVVDQKGRERHCFLNASAILPGTRKINHHAHGCSRWHPHWLSQHGSYGRTSVLRHWLHPREMDIAAPKKHIAPVSNGRASCKPASSARPRVANLVVLPPEDVPPGPPILRCRSYTG